MQHSDSEDDVFDNEPINNEEEEEEEEDVEKELTFEERLQKLQKEQEAKRRRKHKQEMEQIRKSKLEQKDKKPEIENKQSDSKKKHKHAPREMSSKVFVPRVANVTKQYRVKKQVSRDPRFDSLSAGSVVEKSSQKSLEKKYSFLRDMQRGEVDNYKQMLKDKDLDRDQKREIQQKMSKIETRLKNYDHEQLMENVKEEYYKKEKELVAEKGKKPYFLKDADLKHLVNKRKRESMSGAKLEKFEKKKRLKTKSKQHNLMPTTRRKGE